MILQNHESPYYNLENMKLLRLHVAHFTFHTSNWNQLRNILISAENEQIALRMLPTTISLIHSIVELINSGWLYTSEIVFRSALERTATISYMLTKKEDAMVLWRRGWKMRERPSLIERIETFPTTSPATSRIDVSSASIDSAKKGFISMVPSLNSAVHGDDFSLQSTIVKSEEGFDHYNHANDLESPDYASSLSLLTSYLPIFLTLVLDNTFPLYMPQAAK